MKKTIWIIVAIVIIFIGYLLLQNKKAPTPLSNTQENKMKPVPAPEMTPEQKAQAVAGETAHSPTNLSFDVNGGNFYFTPSIIKVKKDDTVTINFKNDGGMHNFVIDEFNATTKATKSGETDSITFKANKVGSFEYYCSIGSHRQMGMKGTLIVE